MRFMARRAPFEPHRRMFERKRSALIAMAFDTAGLISRECLAHCRPRRPMRIMAIHARHGIFGDLMTVWLLKLRHHLQVASGAQFVDLFGGPRDQPQRPIRVDGMAGDAGNRILHMAALNASGLRCLIQMTSHADLVRLNGGKFVGIPDIFRRN